MDKFWKDLKAGQHGEDAIARALAVLPHPTTKALAPVEIAPRDEGAIHHDISWGPTKAEVKYEAAPGRAQRTQRVFIEIAEIRGVPTHAVRQHLAPIDAAVRGATINGTHPDAADLPGPCTVKPVGPARAHLAGVGAWVHVLPSPGGLGAGFAALVASPAAILNGVARILAADPRDPWLHAIPAGSPTATTIGYAVPVKTLTAALRDYRTLTYTPGVGVALYGRGRYASTPTVHAAVA